MLIKDLEEIAVREGEFRAAHIAFRHGEPSLTAHQQAQHVAVERHGLVPVRGANADPSDTLHQHW